MLLMYVVYCVALSFNTSLERWAKSYNISWLPKDEEPAEQGHLVTYKSLQDENRAAYTGPAAVAPGDPYNAPQQNTGQFEFIQIYK